MKTMLFALSTAATIAAASLIPATAGAMALPARLVSSATAPTLVHDHCRPTWHCGYGGCGWRSSCGRHMAGTAGVTMTTAGAIATTATRATAMAAVATTAMATTAGTDLARGQRLLPR